MAVDIFKLQGTVEVDTSQAERGLKGVEQSARQTERTLNSLGGSRGVSFGFDVKGLGAINRDALRTKGILEQIGNSGAQSVQKFTNALKPTGDALKVIRETTESVGSEIIESFGVDGDVANVLAQNLNKVSLSTIAIGGAMVGAVAGVVALTAAMAGLGADIKRTADLTGLSTDEVQRFENAASAAGAKANTFTDAIKSLRDRAKEATRGNIEIAQTFQLLGVNAQDAARNAGPAFEALLATLAKVPDTTQRAAIIQRVFGDASDDVTASLLRLSDANGQLLGEVNKLSVALDKQAVEDLDQLDQKWNLTMTRLTNASKKAGLSIIEALEFIGLALAGETDKADDTGAALGRLGAASKTAGDLQGAAAYAFGNATGKINEQTGAVAALAKELDSVRLDGLNTFVDQKIKQIAANSKTAADAVKNYKKELALNDDFFGASGLTAQVKKNQEAIDEVRNPKKKSGGGRAKELTELQQLQKQLREINKDISGFQAINSQEFKLRISLEEGRAFKQQLEQIFTLRRSLGEAVRVPFPKTAEGAEKEIERLNALKAGLEGIKKLQGEQGKLLQIVPGQQAEEISKVTAALDELIGNALPQAADLTTEAALAQNEFFQSLQKTNPALAEYYRNQAKAADETLRNVKAGEAFKSLQDSLNGELQGSLNLSKEQETALKLQGEAYKNLSGAQKDALLDLARQVDAQAANRKALEESQRSIEDFANTTRGLFDTLFEQGPKKFFDQLLQTVKRSLAQIASDIATSGVLKALKLEAPGAGGGGQSSGGNFLSTLLGLGKQALGSATSGNRQQTAATSAANRAAGSVDNIADFLTPGIAGGNPAQSILKALPGRGQQLAPNILRDFLTGGIAGGNPAQQILGSGQQSGGSPLQSILGIFKGQNGGGLRNLLQKVPLLGRLFGRGAGQATGTLASRAAGAAAQAGNAVGKTSALAGSFASLASGGLLAGGGLLGGLAGGKSPLGQLIGGVGGTLLAGAAGAAGLFGGGVAAALPALFSNPFTAIIGAGLVGGALLFRLFGNKDLKSLKGLIRGEYGIEVKSNKVLENVKALGESKFGKDFKKRQIETVRLPETKDLLVEYAARTGQKGNSKLVSTANLQDEFSSGNQFGVKLAGRREFGGPVNAGAAYLVGERRPEVFVPRVPGTIVPSVGQYQKGGGGMSMADLTEMARQLAVSVEAMNEAVGHFKGISANDLLTKASPAVVAGQVRKSFRAGDPEARKLQVDINGKL